MSCFWQCVTHQTTNTHVLPVRWQTLPPPPTTTDSCRKMFLVMPSERMCTPSTHTIAFPKRQFPPKRGRESSQRKQNYFLPFFSRLGKENKINLYFCLLFRFGLCVFPFFHTVFLLATNNWHGFTGLPSKVKKKYLNFVNETCQQYVWHCNFVSGESCGSCFFFFSPSPPLKIMTGNADSIWLCVKTVSEMGWLVTRPMTMTDDHSPSVFS